ncbi:conserved hypothetical protein [Trichinella spiralis]|uniref:hypothetical protein n=1 Tax=Trichinella spiralis TaxID=6334 RepID=UPI0001EFC1B6|nr:conserved hypothetical protein [Trichinella spiralis]
MTTYDAIMNIGVSIFILLTQPTPSHFTVAFALLCHGDDELKLPCIVSVVGHQLNLALQFLRIMIDYPTGSHFRHLYIRSAALISLTCLLFWSMSVVEFIRISSIRLL